MTGENEASGSDGTLADAIEVVQHVRRPLGEVWARLTQTEGMEALLGEGARLGGKGDSWRAGDGTYGVTRSYHPAEQIRVSWHADEQAPPTLVDLQMAGEDDGTRLVLRHENLTPDLDRAALTQRWEGAIRKLVDTA